MSKGQYILPPALTGAKSMAAFGNTQCDTSKVYISTSYLTAALFAAAIPNGAIYEVDPVGELQDDPDCQAQWMSYACEKAKILKRHKLTKAHREKILAVIMDQTPEPEQRTL